MALNLDPEFVRYVQGIYGNADLDGKVIKQLYQTWKSNPQFIINAYNQKNQPKAVSQAKSQLAPKAQLNPGQINKPEIAQDDLSGITNFGDAFKVARQKGLSQFKWKGTKANPSGMFGTQLATTKSPKSQGKKKLTPSIEVGEPLATNAGVIDQKWTNHRGSWVSIDRPYYDNEGNKRTSTLQFLNPRNIYGNIVGNNYLYQGYDDFGINDNGNLIGKEYRAPKPQVRQLTPRKQQQGGTMQQQQSSQEQELQKAFLAYLIQDAAQQGIQLQSEQDLQAYAQQLGEEGIKAKYQEFMQKMQGGTMAKLGTKLEYLKKLKGVNETDYYKQGGSFCKTHQQHHMETAQKGKKLNAVQQFKKDMKTKDEASRDSIAINKWQDQDTMAKKGNKGNFKKGTWVPDRKKYKK